MDGFLRADHGATSRSGQFLADDVASICPLITPSPPTNDLINPLPEPIEPNYQIGEQLAEKLQQVTSGEKGVDSASSSSSALAEPACTQLLNHRNAYHHITKDEESAAQEANGKTQMIQLSFRNPPEDYFFMSWNWPLIRKISTWLFISGLIAMVALVVAMISTLPKTCNPPTQWYQGNLLYEIFPAKFHSSKRTDEGDIKGITLKSHYIKLLGARGVRLNSIFESPNYPQDFENVTNLLNIASVLGDIDDFRGLVKDLKSRNISLILDLPLYPYLKSLGPKNIADQKRNETNSEITKEFLVLSNDGDLVGEAILYWTLNGVDGFYLKGLEHFVEDANFARFLRKWKKILGPDRILIVDEKVINQVPKSDIKIVLNNVDLVDVKLTVANGMTQLNRQINSILNSTLFSERGMPWVHWTLGNVNSDRLANVLPYSNATLGATLLQMMLPGTPSIFYGDEIGLQDASSPASDLLKHAPQLSMLPWSNSMSENLAFEAANIISKMSNIRSDSPSIYMNSVYKEGDNKANAEVKYSQKDLLVVQRWYPRRKPYVIVCNLGKNQITEDLSTLLYSGDVVVGPRIGSTPGTISFKDVSLYSGESVVIMLD